LLAVLDSFVYDPLITWRLLNTASNKPKKEKEKMEMQKAYPEFVQRKSQEATRDRGASLI
jgi:FKBP12-rapamycin complex-associated protein